MGVAFLSFILVLSMAIGIGISSFENVALLEHDTILLLLAMTKAMNYDQLCINCIATQ
jgi:hypothetical protein